MFLFFTIHRTAPKARAWAAAAAADHSSGGSDRAVQSKDLDSDHAVQSQDRNSLLSQARVEATNHVNGLKVVKQSIIQAEEAKHKQKTAVKAQKED